MIANADAKVVADHTRQPGPGHSSVPEQPIGPHRLSQCSALLTLRYNQTAGLQPQIVFSQLYRASAIPTPSTSEDLPVLRSATTVRFGHGSSAHGWCTETPESGTQLASGGDGGELCIWAQDEDGTDLLNAPWRRKMLCRCSRPLCAWQHPCAWISVLVSCDTRLLKTQTMPDPGRTITLGDSLLV